MLLTAGRDGTARVWDWRAGKLLGPPLPHHGELQDVSFLNKDRWVLTKSSDDSVQIWEWRTGRPIAPARRVAGAAGGQVRVTPDGRRAVVASSAYQVIHVLDLASWIDVDDPRFPPEQLQTIAELISGQRVEHGSSVVGLTTPEWLERWRSYRGLARGDLQR